MRKVEHIKKFIFGIATYHVGDGQDNFVKLTINYKANKYTIVDGKSTGNPEFRLEIEQVAQKLLRKKHEVNFVKRLTK